FKRGDAPLEYGRCRIADATGAMALGFEIKQRGAVIGALELVGDGLVDRNRDRPGRRLGLVTAVDRHRIAFHANRRVLPPSRRKLAPTGFLSVAVKANNTSDTNAK